MEKKIIFFDVDGTLVSDTGGIEHVPESAKRAIALTRAKGNLVYLCTGRSKAEIYDFILECGIDGVIGAGGGYIEIGNQMLYHKKVTNKAVNHMVDYFDTNNFDYYVESNGGLFASKNLVKRLERIIYGDYENDPQAKARYGDNSGELSVPNIHKANAIETLINYLGIERKNTYAFGDGMNDKEMLEYVNIGIAVGNAKEGLKAVADEITDNIDNNGIYNSMKKHNLI